MRLWRSPHGSMVASDAMIGARGRDQDISERLRSSTPSEGVPPKTDPLPRHCPVKIPLASANMNLCWIHVNHTHTRPHAPNKAARVHLGLSRFYLPFLLFAFLFSCFWILHLLSDRISHSQVSSLHFHDTPTLRRTSVLPANE